MTVPSLTAAAAAVREERRRCIRVSIWLLFLCNVFVFQLLLLFGDDRTWYDPILSSSTSTADDRSRLRLAAAADDDPSFAAVGRRPSGSPSLNYVLDYPRGPAVALPSIRLSSDEETTIDRQFYGGVLDKVHLGGFIPSVDLEGISPAVWKHMVSYFGIKSLLDVGCGRGISTSWFVLHGVDAQCVEGSHDAILQTMVPSPSTQLVEHDFARGPWWPSQTVDAVWAIEFLEHVGRNFHHNYLPSFRKAALLFVTFSTWGGWHHVEVHNEEWWIAKMTAYGFVHSPQLSDMVRRVAWEETNNMIPSGIVPNKNYYPSHLVSKLTVFINPIVAALPEHAHLFAEHGCFQEQKRKKQPGGGSSGSSNVEIVHRPCGVGPKGKLESRLPMSWYPITMTTDMDKAWENLVRQHINATSTNS